MHNVKVTVGKLRVKVVECSRLPVIERATKTYCTIAMGTYKRCHQGGEGRGLTVESTKGRVCATPETCIPQFQDQRHSSYTVL